MMKRFIDAFLGGGKNTGNSDSYANDKKKKGNDDNDKKGSGKDDKNKKGSGKDDKNKKDSGKDDKNKKDSGKDDKNKKDSGKDDDTDDDTNLTKVQMYAAVAKKDAGWEEDSDDGDSDYKPPSPYFNKREYSRGDNPRRKVANNWLNNYSSTGSQAWLNQPVSNGQAKWKKGYTASADIKADVSDSESKEPASKKAKTNTKTKTSPITSPGTAKLIFFVVIYLALFALLALLLPDSMRLGLDRAVSVTIDTVFGGLLLVLLLSGAYVLDKEDRKELVRELGEFLANPTSVIGVSISLFVLYLAKNVLQVPSGENKPWLVSSLENIGWLFFVITFAQFVSHYIFKIDLMNAVRKFVNFGKEGSPASSSENKEKDPGSTAPSDTVNEVFNVSDNVYTYTDAQGVCSALGARLATYSEVEAAYNNGGEWCNYGWSADQLALFPTQQKTWDSLQSSCKTKNTCGRPGVNGGQMDAKVKFGANCFGKKPSQTESTTAKNVTATESANGAIMTPHDKLVADRAAFYKANPEQISNINKFNSSKWSRF